jgi:glycosyltransferase involved in cell wall biosynthesis
VTRYAVVVPTFRRHEDLARCLAALGAQRRHFDEVVVVSRADDPGSAVAAAAALPGCTVLELDEPGALAAIVAGVRHTSADVVCFTDDDAIPPDDWLERLDAAYGGAALVGGVGGRDLVGGAAAPPAGPPSPEVGRLTWYGRHLGGHHLGVGGPRDVAFLKGVNSSYRRHALGLPLGLRGSGAQAHFEVAIGRFVRARGYRLVYDPALTVEHLPAPRHSEDDRDAPTPRAVADASYNLVVAIGGARGLWRVAYATLLGDRGAPGLVRALIALLAGDRETLRRVVPSMRGSVEGGWALLRGRRLAYATFD